MSELSEIQKRIAVIREECRDGHFYYQDYLEARHPFPWRIQQFPEFGARTWLMVPQSRQFPVIGELTSVPFDLRDVIAHAPEDLLTLWEMFVEPQYVGENPQQLRFEFMDEIR